MCLCAYVFNEKATLLRVASSIRLGCNLVGQFSKQPDSGLVFLWTLDSIGFSDLDQIRFFK